MKIVYVGKDQKRLKAILDQTYDVLLLTFDKWDDYSYKTTFPTVCRIKGDMVETGSVKVLIEDQKTSFLYLDQLVSEGWDGVLPIPSSNYVSTPGALSFYEQIEGWLGLPTTVGIAEVLRDASYLSRIKEDPDALRLIQTDGFRVSLQREPGSVAAFLDGWKFLGGERIFVGDQTVIFRAHDDLHSLTLRFASEHPLPHDINVLVGPNGTGKSQLLQQLVYSWLRPDANKREPIGFQGQPNLNQIVVVSYSPFELFPVDSREGELRKDQDVYRYFGLRGRKRAATDARRGSNEVILSREVPKRNAAQSLIDCAADDQKYGAIRDWSKKVLTLQQVLAHAFDFDSAAISVPIDTDVSQLYSNPSFGVPTHFDHYEEDPDNDRSSAIRYIPITSDRVSELNVKGLREHVHDQAGIEFLKDGSPLHLSSGQRLFSYIVVNILGAIRRNSLILVDEPELFLHSTLEIEFIRMLKTILSSYACKALLATHSLVTVREIPRDCVHVFELTADGLVIKTPPFETFGGDVQRISSYVFGDKSVSKPFEDWLRQKLKEYGSAEALLADLGQDINEELLIQIKAMDQNRW